MVPILRPSHTRDPSVGWDYDRYALPFRKPPPLPSLPLTQGLRWTADFGLVRDLINQYSVLYRKRIQINWTRRKKTSTFVRVCGLYARSKRSGHKICPFLFSKPLGTYHSRLLLDFKHNPWSSHFSSLDKQRLRGPKGHVSPVSRNKKQIILPTPGRTEFYWLQNDHPII